MLEVLSTVKAFGGTLTRYAFDSKTLNSRTTFAVFLPSDAAGEKFPALYYLSGLTCTDENVSQKGCALRACAERGLALIMPDTSPRGDDVPNDDAWDIGHGAGFYLDATEAPFSRHYNMYSFTLEELPSALEASGLPIDTTRASIFGHSMGGHGALTIALKNPERFQSVSAFAPVSNPTASDSPWGRKALTTYLGSADSDAAKAYDATELMKSVGKNFNKPILIDQGAADSVYTTQLYPERFVRAAEAVGRDVSYRLHDGYDHSYYFVSTFMSDHIDFHAKALGC